jgi:Uma2 family endonuclease
MAASVIFQDEVRIPLEVRSLSNFRAWTGSAEFPKRGRIDYISGNMEVDMSPEDLFTHGTLKGEIYASLLARVKQLDLGHLFTDSTRICHIEANLSVEPDILLVSFESIEAGRVRLVPQSSGAPDRFIEIEGPAVLIVEIASDASVQKDTDRLKRAYFAAGVREYWTVDAREEPMQLEIYGRGAKEFLSAQPDPDGFRTSHVLGLRYRLTRTRNRHGFWQYELEGKPA